MKTLRATSQNSKLIYYYSVTMDRLLRQQHRRVFEAGRPIAI